MDQWISNKEIPEAYDPNSLMLEEIVEMEDETIKQLRSIQLSTSGAFIIDTTMNFNQTVIDLFEIEGSSITLDFMLEGSPIERVEKLAALEDAPQEYHTIRYTPSFKGTFEMSPFQPINYFCVILSEDFYFNLIGQQSELQREFASQVAGRKHSYFAPVGSPITASIKNAISDILRCKRKGILKRMFVEAKIRELLVLQLDQLKQEPKLVSGKVFLKEGELHKLMAAKEILESNYANPPLLSELSKMVSLNEFKLKNGFKEKFNTTIYQYIIRLKMENARYLLHQKTQSIGEIAYLSGYKDVSNFSTAFKAFYGFSPKKMRG